MSEMYQWWAPPKNVEEVEAYLSKLFKLGNESEVNILLRKIMQKKIEDSLMTATKVEEK